MIDDDVLCVGVADGALHRLAVGDGSILATRETGGRPQGRPAITQDALVVLVGSDAIVAFTRSLSTAMWSQSGGSEWSSLQPLLWDDVVVVGTREGDVVGYRTADGTEAWRFAVEGVVRGLGADDATLYVGTLAGTLYAVR